MRKTYNLSVGFGGGKIHTCKNDFILYREAEYEELEKYPICEFVRRKDGDDDENCNRRKGGSKKLF
jgi:hypothetical protein